MRIDSFKTKTYYEVLGVSRDSDVKEIKHKYHELARVYHPDSRFYEDIIDEKLSEEQIELFKIITNAYHTLIDPAKRSEYDSTLTPILSKKGASWEDNSDPFWKQAGATKTKHRKRASTFGQTGAHPFKSTMHGELKSPVQEHKQTRNKMPVTGRKFGNRLNPIVTGLAMGIVIIALLAVITTIGLGKTQQTITENPEVAQPQDPKWHKDLAS